MTSAQLACARLCSRIVTCAAFSLSQDCIMATRGEVLADDKEWWFLLCDKLMENKMVYEFVIGQMF